MKKFNKGFSLAEVLIAVGIMSVLATVGFNLTKKNLDLAYNAYVYNGLSSMSLALRDAKRNVNTSFTANDWQDRLCSLFSCITENRDGIQASATPRLQNGQGEVRIVAPNGIIYRISVYGFLVNELTSGNQNDILTILQLIINYL